MGPWMGFVWGAVWVLFGLCVVYLKQQERLRIYDLLDKATREGRALPPELLRRLAVRPNGCSRNLGLGVILIGVSLGMIAVGVLHYYSDADPHPRLFWGPFGMFPLPLFIGLAFLMLAWIRRNDRADL